MSATDIQTVRTLAQTDFDHPVLSVILDLDPSQFPTPKARDSQITSILDTAHKEVEAAEGNGRITHADKVAFASDLERLTGFLREDLDASGARAVAIYASGQSDFFQAVTLQQPAPTRVEIGPLPNLEPLLTPAEPASICVVLVDRRSARIFTYDRGGQLVERERQQDDVHGRVSVGGWSEANLQRSVDADAEAHLRQTGEDVFKLWQELTFDKVVLGGQHDTLVAFSEVLHSELKPLLADQPLSIDLSAATLEGVAQAVQPLREGWRVSAQEAAVARLNDNLDNRPGARSATGLAATLAALSEGQVDTLVLAVRFDEPGGICPTCGQLYSTVEDVCANDGTALTSLPSLRNAMIRDALRRGGDALVLDSLPEAADSPVREQDRADVESFGRVGALLRY